MTNDILDIAGVGVGPFNLSVAALMDGQAGLSCRFFDSKPRFAWHPGMMLPDTSLQTSWMKDLVSPVQPTSPYSFMAYLVHHRRFYQFITAGQATVSRREFNDYLGWVAGQLDSLQFGADVHEVDFADGHFAIRHSRGMSRARNLLLGSGQVPATPGWASGLGADRCIHASEFMARTRSFAGQHVAVVGGGQSGAEIVLHLLRQAPAGVARISWISRRPNFQALDEVAFSNEHFTPGYVQRFHALPDDRRAHHVAAQKLASDGASPATLQAIYQRTYQLHHVEHCPGVARLLPHREATRGRQMAGRIILDMHNGFDGGTEDVTVDKVILATGYAPRQPAYLAPLRQRLSLDEAGRFILDPSFRVAWDGPAGHAIFAQNAGRHSHGIAEPQLSLMAWRSASIVNAVMGHDVFELEDPTMIEWDSSSQAAAPGVPYRRLSPV